MGNTVELHNGLYKYELPPEPSDEKEILFYDKPKHEQFWRTPEVPDFRRFNVRQRIEFVERERERWSEGMWFFNNGEPTYITGMHYDHLTNMTFDDEKAWYLDSQRKDFYFRDYTWKDPLCWGRVFAKPRRYGMSMEEITEATYRSTEDINRHVGLLSLKDTKCKETLFNPIVDSMIKRPKYLKPTFYKPNGKKPKASLKYSDDDIDEGEELDIVQLANTLGGWVLPSATVSSAFDAFKMHYITMDEVWKWLEASPRETLEAHLKCCDVGGSKVGIISMLSTLGDSEDMKKAIADGIYIYMNSDPNKRNANGFTTTRLYKYFVSAIYAKFDFKDRFGKINEDQAYEMIMNDRADKEEGSQDWINEVRRNPLTEEEAMATAEGGSAFDAVRLQKRISIITALPKGKEPYLKGELLEDKNGRVTFEQNEKGLWLVSQKPYQSIIEKVDRSNRWGKDHQEFYKITESPEGCIGFDPVRYAQKQTSSGNVSRASIIARYKFDWFRKGNLSAANRYAGLYLGRPDDPHVPNREAFKAAKYWGFPIMHENQVESVYDDFLTWKALDFLLKDQKRDKYGMWTDKNQKVITDGANMFQTYIKRPQKDMIDWLMEIPFIDLLKDAKDFTPSDTVKFDVFMSNVMLEWGMKQILYTNFVDEDEFNKEQTGIFNALFQIQHS